MSALLLRFVALATELEDMCRHTLASFLLALGLNVEETEGNGIIALNGERASCKKGPRVAFKNLLARPGFRDSLQRQMIDKLGCIQAHRDLKHEVKNHAMAIAHGVELLMQKIVCDGTPVNLNDEDVALLKQRIPALGETLRRSHPPPAVTAARNASATVVRSAHTRASRMPTRATSLSPNAKRPPRGRHTS